MTDPIIRDEDPYDFYRCHSCGRLITKIEEHETLLGRRQTICPCGSRHYRPSWPKLQEWLLPRVLVFTWKRLWGVA